MSYVFALSKSNLQPYFSANLFIISFSRRVNSLSLAQFGHTFLTNLSETDVANVLDIS